MASESGFRCACFFTHNFFSRLLQGHFRYIDKQNFLRDYGERLGFSPTSNSFSIGNGADSDDHRPPASNVKVDDVISELEEELERRVSLAKEITRRKTEIFAGYSPKHAQVYSLREEFLAPEFLKLVSLCRESDDLELQTHLKDASLALKSEKSAYATIFSFPVFTTQFCALMLEELNHFEESSLPKGRPNTMNRKGVLLNELLQFEKGFVDVLRNEYIQPIVEKLIPGIYFYILFMIYIIGRDRAEARSAWSVSW